MVELKGFGWNILTLSFLATTLSTLLAVWGLVQQIRKIWSEKSGKAVSVTWFGVFLFMFASHSIYGLYRNSLALILSGLRIPFLLTVLYGLWRFKGFTQTEKVAIAGLSLGLLCMLFSSEKVSFFLGYTYLGVAAAAFQPWEIWKNKSAGAVSIKLLVIYNISVSFWAVYGLALNDKAILIMGLSYAVVYTTAIILWIKYRKRDSASKKTPL